MQCPGSEHRKATDRLVGYISKEKRDTLLQEIAEVEKPGYIIYGDNEACIFCGFKKTKKGFKQDKAH